MRLKDILNFFIAPTFNFKKEKVKKLSLALNKQMKNGKRYFLDKEYNLPTKEQLKRIINYCKVYKQFKKEEFDCDDFARELWTKVKRKYPLLSFGYAYNHKHVFNVCVDKNLNVWVIEPQTNWIFKSRKNKTYKYYLEMVIL